MHCMISVNFVEHLLHTPIWYSISEIWEKNSLGVLKNKIANPKRKTYPSHEYYFKTHRQMQDLFADLKCIENTKEIADKCDFKFNFKTRYYPTFSLPNSDSQNRKEEVKTYLYQLCQDSISKRYTKEKLDKIKKLYPDKNPLDVVKNRLNYD